MLEDEPMRASPNVSDPVMLYCWSGVEPVGSYRNGITGDAGEEPRIITPDAVLALRDLPAVEFDPEVFRRLQAAVEQANAGLQPIITTLNAYLKRLGESMRQLAPHLQQIADAMRDESGEEEEEWERSCNAYHWSPEAGDALMDEVRELS